MVGSHPPTPMSCGKNLVNHQGWKMWIAKNETNIFIPTVSRCHGTFFLLNYTQDDISLHSQIGPRAPKMLLPCQVNPEELPGILLRDINSLNIQQYYNFFFKTNEVLAEWNKKLKKDSERKTYGTLHMTLPSSAT